MTREYSIRCQASQRWWQQVIQIPGCFTEKSVIASAVELFMETLTICSCKNISDSIWISMMTAPKRPMTNRKSLRKGTPRIRELCCDPYGCLRVAWFFQGLTQDLFFQASPIHFRKYTHQVRSLGKIVYGSPRWRLPIKRSMANQKSLKRGTLGIKGIVTHIMHMAATGWHDSSKASHKAHFSGQPCLLLKGQYSPSSLPQKYPVPAQRNMLVSSYGTCEDF